MRTFFLGACTTIFILSCKNNNEVPASILPVNKMKVVLRDMMQADIFVNDYILSSNPSLNKDSVRLIKYSEVLAIHQISKLQFQKSFNYYQLHPLQLKTVMDSIGMAAAPTQLINPFDVSDSLNQPDPVIQKPSVADSVSQILNKRKRLPKL